MYEKTLNAKGHDGKLAKDALKHPLQRLRGFFGAPESV